MQQPFTYIYKSSNTKSDFALPKGIQNLPKFISRNLKLKFARRNLESTHRIPLSSRIPLHGAKRLDDTDID